MPVRPGGWRYHTTVPPRTDAAMPSSHTPAPRCQWFCVFARALDPRSGRRLAALFLGLILAHGRQTLSHWIQAAGLSGQYRRCYATGAAVGHRTERAATRLLLELLKPLVTAAPRRVLGLDDTPAERYRPKVQGVGVHHNPTPGPAGGPFVCGHVWVVLGLLVAHPLGGSRGLALVGPAVHPPEEPRDHRSEARPAFATTLEMAVELVRWAHGWLTLWAKAVWVVAGGRMPRPRCSSPCGRSG